MLLAVSLGASTPALPDVANARVTTSYAIAYSEDGVQVLLSGKAVVQGECYRIEGNGVEIYCDANAVWIVDPKAREVYVESPASLQEFVSAKISSVRDFNLSDTKTTAPENNPGEFTFRTDTLGTDWVITDLR